MTRFTRVSRSEPRSEHQVTRAYAPRGTAVFVLRGVIGDELVDELREALQGAIEEGLVALVLDLSEVEAISSSARELVSSASSTLADRGGTLLAWTAKDRPGDASYVMRELRDASEVAPRDRSVMRKTQQ
jgi:anti-anti-sigma regulatory factor